MPIDNFNHTIDIWINELHRYNFTQLCTKPNPNSWSLGQVYMHVISQTSYYIEQIAVCVSTNDHWAEEASPGAKKMFLANAFPNELIEGPPSNADTPQPTSKEQLAIDLIALKSKMGVVVATMEKSIYHGKTRHPGLHYFSASDWLQFTDMHLRHHLRQKERVDAFLGMGE